MNTMSSTYLAIGFLLVAVAAVPESRGRGLRDFPVGHWVCTTASLYVGILMIVFGARWLR